MLMAILLPDIADCGVFLWGHFKDKLKPTNEPADKKKQKKNVSLCPEKNYTVRKNLLRLHGECIRIDGGTLSRKFNTRM
jgi:hypothetical protein